MKSFKLVSGALGQPGQYNTLVDDAKGASALLAHQQLGAFALGTNPSNAQTLTFTVNGTGIVLTGKTGSIANPGEFKIVGTAALTLANVMNLLQNPWLTNANQIALTLANQQLLAYIGVSLSGTTITVYSLNTTISASLTSFSGSTTFTSGSYTAQTMELYVEPGTYYINGTQVKFAGGSTPLVTAPVSNPRIDLLTIDNTGTLAWTTGSENVSPVPPTYPTYTKVPICELYNVVGETALYDFANQQSGQGYIQADVRSFPDVITDFTNISQDFIPDADNTRNLGSNAKQFNTIYSHNILSGGQPVAFTKFGGTGADGALSITSGTTTINLGGASYYVKNYSSISITGTGQLTFSNPSANGCVVVLKSTGNVTITSSATPAILGDSLGASAGNHGVSLSGKGPRSPYSFASNFGQPGPSIETTYTNIVGEGVYLSAGPFSAQSVFAGAGAGGGSINAGTNGAGGLGLYIECEGALNFTQTITCKGQNGGNGSGSTSWTTAASTSGGGSNTDGGVGTSEVANTGATTTFGGSGGGGGCVVILYNSLTANSGTITVTGGTGGTGTRQGGQSGGTGFSYVGLNTEFT
jgi:hypothetical protein